MEQTEMYRKDIGMMEKEYLTYEEAMEVLGVKRSTLHTMITEQGVKFHKFKYDKRRYLANADVKKLKQMREKPWTIEEKTSEEAVA
jgi:excisionase family DNA binding protein